MTRRLDPLVARKLRDQHGVASRRELRLLGVTARNERERVARGEWDHPAPGAVRLVAAPRTPEQDLMVAVIAGGLSAVASHQSAAWLWGLVPIPERHAITVHVGMSRPIPGVDVHRLTVLPAGVNTRRGILCTNPLRSLVDLAAVASAQTLDDAIDRGVATQLITVKGLQAEILRLARPGRRGVGLLRAALHRRGMIGGPAPSVLESRVLRVLMRGGIRPTRREVVAGEEGQYRIDLELDPIVLMEVDGYTYHSSPEQKERDERRRNQIRLSGKFLLVYDWRAVTNDGRRVLAECRQALARYGSGRKATG